MTCLVTISPLFLITQSFLMRKQYFNNEETGYFKIEERAATNPMQAMGGMVVICVTLKHTRLHVCFN